MVCLGVDSSPGLLAVVISQCFISPDLREYLKERRASRSSVPLKEKLESPHKYAHSGVVPQHFIVSLVYVGLSKFQTRGVETASQAHL